MARMINCAECLWILRAYRCSNDVLANRQRQPLSLAVCRWTGCQHRCRCPSGSGAFLEMELLLKVLVLALSALSFSILSTAVLAGTSRDLSGRIDPLAPGSAEFVSAVDFFAGELLIGFDVNAYFDARESLARQFDAICGDTFCEGEYDNLTPLAFNCSVAKSTRQIGQCTWTFAGAYSEVDAVTGVVDTKHKVFDCDLQVRGSAADLVRFLQEASHGGASGFEGLRQAVLPGSSRTLMSALGRCLN